MKRRRHPLIVTLLAMVLFTLVVMTSAGFSARPAADTDIVINEVYYRG